MTRALLLLFVLAIWSAEGQQRVYNVLDFHAAGDGKTDDAQLDGNIMAPNNIWTEKEANLLTFFGVDHLTLDGDGEIDGQGAIWWDCYIRKTCQVRPILLGFARCNNLTVTRIHLKDSAEKHMTLFQCSQVIVDSVSVTAPADSPNTDGITVALSNNTYISNCAIQTGDDCVSVLSDTKNITVTQSSVGSLGGSETAMVEQITVSNCSFVGTMTGVRIKSWQGGKGYAKGFLFQSLNMTEVQNPIVIDQFYCPQGNCPIKNGGVAISGAKFIDIQGTSSEQEAIRLLCSQSVPCQDIYFSNINLSWASNTAPANATILNAHGSTAGVVIIGI
ncbi:probable polygalacturonase At1g80170 [Panicum virgatum]|uniref:probable polygalacturonase At1g80170 n=1 Tax=Panicum virgatum TaxID=38727 RepID=UPI0019D63A01|nr:probable polygalacturonase At1g80170 [Panicum virgatum]